MPEPVVSLPPPSPNDFTQDSIRAYFENTWQLYETLFSAVGDDQRLYEQPDPLRHPLVFYVGHTAAFYINKLRMAGLLDDGIDAAAETLFARGVDPHTAAELDGPAAGWPDIPAVRRYREAAHARIHAVIDTLPVGSVGPDHPAWSLFMGLEHDRIHLETSSVLLRQLDARHLRRPDGWRIAPTHTAAPDIRWCDIPARTVTIGRPDGAPLYGWDNEYGQNTVEVAPFQVTAHTVTNRAFLDFVSDGGYADQRLWSDEGWRWRAAQAVTRPRFWVGDADQPRYRAMFEELDMPWAWPVEVNAHEAAAFCRWRGGVRLPTEAEHLALTARAPLDAGDVITHPGYNLNLRYASPTPVDHFTPTQDGIFDSYGNVWEWLADDFAPLPGFKTHPLYEDFSSPYFDTLHATMRGGAWVSSGESASRYYRLWFRRHFYQHAGFRMVRPR